MIKQAAHKGGYDNWLNLPFHRKANRAAGCAPGGQGKIGMIGSGKDCPSLGSIDNRIAPGKTGYRINRVPRAKRGSNNPARQHNAKVIHFGTQKIVKMLVIGYARPLGLVARFHLQKVQGPHPCFPVPVGSKGRIQRGANLQQPPEFIRLPRQGHPRIQRIVKRRGLERV